jgi:serine/threonine-protein kinase RsbT
VAATIAGSPEGRTVGDEVRLPISADVDVVQARQHGRDLAAGAGFSKGDQTVIAAAISEIARNILNYAKRGEIILSVISNGDRQGVVVIAQDAGPGIADVARALQDGYSTSGGLGLGLPGARRLMDEFEITSVLGRGTTVTMKKWRRIN